MTSKPPAPVQAVLDAVDRGDAAAFLACFTSDGVVDDWGREFHGSGEISGWSDKEFIGTQATLEITYVETSNDETTLTAQVGGNSFNGPSNFVFRVEGDRVSRMTIRG
jgi:hypothetical protein